MVELFALSHMRYSVVPIVELSIHSALGFAYHPMQAKDRLGGEHIDFPIGFVYGDNDWNGSDGADELVRVNKHYKTGKS